MTNLLWPGDERAGEHMTDQELLQFMVAVESAWLDALAAAGLAPVAGADLRQLVRADDCELLAVTAEDGGNPVHRPGALLRQRAMPAFGPWIHRGLTSQDVLDTALMLAVRAVVDQLITQLADTDFDAVSACNHAPGHADGRPDPYPARGAHHVRRQGRRLAQRSRRRLRAARRAVHPGQFGGAVGTWSATTELATHLADPADPSLVAERVARSAAAVLGLDYRLPWHTTRAPITVAADALVGCTDCLGPHRLRCRHPGPTGDRRTERTRHRRPRRIFVHATQAQPGAGHPDSPRSHLGTAVGRHAAHRRRAGQRRTPGRLLARRMGHIAHSGPADSWSRAPSAANCWPACRCTPIRWAAIWRAPMFSVNNAQSPISPDSNRRLATSVR